MCGLCLCRRSTTAIKNRSTQVRTALFGIDSNSLARTCASIMVVTHQFSCSCGENTISLSFSNSIPVEVVDRVYCPVCEQNGHPPQQAWPLPGDWFVHFDLEVARFFALAKLDIDPALVNPGFIIDRGFVY